MNILAFVIGFGLGFLALGNTLIALFKHLPYARRLARTHEMAVAQRIDGKLDLWNGPVPYGLIFVGPLVLLTVLVVISAVVTAVWPQWSSPLYLGIGFALFFNLFGLKDPNHRHQRDFNLTNGRLYRSHALTSGLGTLRDEQQLRDVPPVVAEAIEFLLSNDGTHEETPEVLEAIDIVSSFDRPVQDSLSPLYPSLHSSSLEFRRALLRWSAFEFPGKNRQHHFHRAVGSLKPSVKSNRKCPLSR